MNKKNYAHYAWMKSHSNNTSIMTSLETKLLALKISVLVIEQTKWQIQPLHSFCEVSQASGSNHLGTLSSMDHVRLMKWKIL